jgi:hypothetical protein
VEGTQVDEHINERVLIGNGAQRFSHECQGGEA